MGLNVLCLQKDLWNSWVRPHGAQTVGSLDLGGASTQIAFTIADESSGEGLTKITLYGYEYTVYTHSFLCFGKNEAEKTVLAKLVQVLAFSWNLTFQHFI